MLDMPCVAESLFITDRSSEASHLFVCLYTEMTALEELGRETKALRHRGGVER